MSVGVLLAACTETTGVDEPAPADTQALEATAVPTPASLPEPTPTPLPLSLSAEKILGAALVALDGAGTFHFDTDIGLSLQSAGLDLEVPIKVVGDYESADSFRAFMTLSMILAVIDIDFITKDGTTYMKEPGSGVWKVLASGTPAFGDPMQFLRFEATSLKDLALQGIEAVEGVDHYRLTAKAPIGAYGLPSGELGLSFLVGVNDGLPSRISVDGSVVLAEQGSGPLATLGSGDVSASILLTLSEFGETKAIEAPPLGQ